MNRIGRTATPWHLWVVGIVSALWNLGGVASYLATETGNLDAFGMPSDLHSYFYDFPAWAVAFWALGVWGCFFGSLALLLRSKWAVTLFGISIVGLLGTTFYERVVAVVPAELQTTGQTLFAVAIWVITIGLFFYARRMRAAGVLR
ncbi:hypothetical protein [Erythrobacter litoralis]|nr:hypothetical protein [Erythrobacter litoralis]